MFWRIAPLVVGLGLLAATLAGVTPPERCAPAEEAPRPAPARRIRAEGRLVAYPGAEVHLAAEVAGTVSRVLVDEKAAVKKGDLLVELDAAEETAAVAESVARLAGAEADVKLQELELARYERLATQAAASLQDVDRARHALEAARARRDLAGAQLERARAVLARRRLLAPIDGVVTSRAVHPGEAVTPGACVLSIADLARTRIAAEVDEYDLGALRLGAAVRVSAEGFAGASWRGKVEELPDTVVARQLRPQDPGRPMDTRVVLVKVALLGATPLRLGQRVEVEID